MTASSFIDRAIQAALLGLLALIAAPALADSTINTANPVQGVPYNAAPIRQNFAAAASDVTALQKMNYGASAPSSPVLGQLWLETPTAETTYNLKIYDDRTSQWVIVAYFDSLNSLWIAPVGGGLPQTILTDDTTDLGSYPNTVLTVTGAGPVYSFGATSPAGTIKVLTFSGATQIVYNATSLITPGAADINTAANDMIIAVALGSGNWKVMFFQSAAASVPQGGTGRTSLTNHAVLLGAGTSPVNFAVPGTLGYPLLSAGASADPAFGQLNLTIGVTGALPVANGGTGVAAITVHNLLVGNGSSAATLLPPGTTGLPLVSLGASLDPAYQVLGPAGGGTGAGSFTAHAVLVGNGTAAFTPVGPGAANIPLIGQGGAVDPVFAALDLSTAGVTGTLPTVRGGTGVATPAAHTVLVGNNATTMTAVGPGTTAYPFVANGAGADPAFQPLSLSGGGITGQLPIANLPTGMRLPYLSNTNYCVNSSTGSDGNTGFSPSCWATLQHAWNTIVGEADLAGFQAVVDIADGLYAGFAAAGPVVGSLGPSNVVFNGNVVTPGNVTITTVNGVAVSASAGAGFTIQGAKLVATGASTGVCTLASTGAYLIVSSVNFSQCDFAGMYAIDSGTVVTNGAITISGGGATFIAAQTNGLIKIDNTAVTTSGTPNFTTSFASATALGSIHSFSSTFGGTGATGARYGASLNAVIDTNGGGGSYFPGDSAGATSTGGQYN